MTVSKNVINVIQPYWHAGMWVFDDPRVGLSREPFVGGADTMIDRVTTEIPDARTGFIMVFSAFSFPGHQFRLEWQRASGSGNIYYSRDLDIEGWLAAPARSRMHRPRRAARADRLRHYRDEMIAMAKKNAQKYRMRYAPAERLLRLARHLAATRTGLTIDEMAAELEVGRRTAERLRDSLLAMFPQMDWWDDEQRVRRWRLPGSALVGVVEPRAEAVAAIETAARECDGRGEADRAALLREAAITLRSVMRPDALRRAETDIAALMEAEGIAMRPGPRPVIAAGVLPTLRRAILGMQLVVVRYAGPDAKEPATRILCPYGILYGGRGWLVAHVDGLPEMRLWRLDRVVSADLLDRGFQRREDFSLSRYAAQSFGVFQEQPIDVVLRFAPEVADDAEGWLFHPCQSKARDENGSLTVNFRAGGRQEMCWHLFTWGAAVDIVSPYELRELLEDSALTVARHHQETRRADANQRTS
jgi:predicted DNA-binding transcriptional regulator YafY